MPPDKAPHEFPNVKAKLQKPTKQSAFEKQKAEAEAKRLREEAETAAVYQDFIKSFDREENGDGNSDNNGTRPMSFGGQGHLGPRSAPGGPASAGTSRRHFGALNARSGPGSLGPAPASFGKKRSFQDMSRGARDRHDDFDRPSMSVPKAFRTSDDEDEEVGGATDKAEERAIAKPTLRLINLPSGTSPAMVKALLPSNLVAEHVKIQASAGAGSSDKKSVVAIVTLSKETPANDIEAAVSALQNKYLGFGHYLSLHRHLSSAVTSAALVDLPGSASEAHPFGAKPVEQPSDSYSRQRDHGFQRGFAPPTNYDQMSNMSRSTLFHVPVKPPEDIRLIRLISKVIEQVLDQGPEFEALLMSRPEVQREEKWSWIWNARSSGGVWYRWRLWEVVTGSDQGHKKGKFVPLFEGSFAWKAPDERLPFEYITGIDEFVSDSEYNSSDDEDLDGEANRDNQGEEKEKSFLNPLEKAKLTHLLARLPPTISKLRKGDIARVTTFAITHASRGVEEVVGMIVSNIEKPFSMTMANRDRNQDSKDSSGQGTAADETNSGDGQDASVASLVGLYAVSDILSSSSASGVRHAWRFRQLFEVALRSRKVFEHLGMMAEKFNWGRLRAEKWKRSVTLVLSLWEGWCVFAAESQDHFVQSFENPPSAKVDDKPDEGQKKNKWKPVEYNQTPEKESRSSSVLQQKQGSLVSERKDAGQHVVEDDVGGEPIEEEDIEGEPIEEDDIEGQPIDEDDIEGQPIDEDDIEGQPVEEDDIEGEPIDEDDIEGEPLCEDDLEGEPMGEETVKPSHAPIDLAVAGDKGPADKVQLVESKGDSSSTGRADLSRPKGVGRKPRMRAVDMFADSDGSDNGS